MKKLLIFLVLIFTTLNVNAMWLFVTDADEGSSYLKSDSIRRDNNIVTHWRLLDFKSEKKTSDGKRFNSIKSKVESNCKTEEHRTIFMVVYSERMGEGKILDSYNRHEEFTHVIPDTLGHTFHKFVCNKK